MREDRNREKEREEREKERDHQIRRVELEQRALSIPGDALVIGQTPRSSVQLPEWTTTTRPETYFNTVEKLFEASGMSDKFWVGQMLHKVSERAREVYASLPAREANVYITFKQAVMDEYRISPTINRRNFFSWSKKPNHTYKEYVKVLTEQLTLWTEGQQFNAVNWPEKLLRFRLDSQFPEELNLFLLDKEAKTIDQVAELADGYVLNRKIVTKVNDSSHVRNRDHPSNNLPRNSVRATVVNTQNDRPFNTRADWPRDRRPLRPTKYCAYCQSGTHDSSTCWVNPSSPRYRGPRTQTNNAVSQRPSHHHSTLFASEFRERETDRDIINPLLGQFTGQAQISRDKLSTVKFPRTYLRDPGSTVSLVFRDCLPSGQIAYTGDHLTVRGINASGTYPIAEIYVTSPVYTGPLLVGVTTLRAAAGIDIILGNDIISQHVDQTVYCGVVTRSQCKQRSAVNINIAPLFEESNALTEKNVDLDNGPEEPLPVTKPVSSPQDSVFGVDLPLDMTYVSLLKEQEKDASLTSLWVMAQPEAQGSDGYYVKDDPKLLMRRERPLGRDRTKEWLVKLL